MLRGERYDDVVVGGGFYGCCLALFLRDQGGRVALVEAGPSLLSRASYANQARIHNGYHYPRSFLTAWRSFLNFPRFVREFSRCVVDDFQKVYAVARDGSQVNARQFRQFCLRVGSPLRPAPAATRRLFDPRLVEEVFEAREFAFDSGMLRELLASRLDEVGVEVSLSSPVRSVTCDRTTGDGLTVRLEEGSPVRASRVFNCTYAGINALLAGSGVTPIPLKHELAELALLVPPPELAKVGITVMDGPFFSFMPFPAAGLHSLSHVRYTPHRAWGQTLDPAAGSVPESRWLYMVKDAQRYVPAMAGARYVRSLFEEKALLAENELDDGRPILLKEHAEVPGLTTILGGKIDNIFDVLDCLKVAARPHLKAGHGERA